MVVFLVAAAVAVWYFFMYDPCNKSVCSQDKTFKNVFKNGKVCFAKDTGCRKASQAKAAKRFKNQASCNTAVKANTTWWPGMSDAGIKLSDVCPPNSSFNYTGSV